MGIKWGSESTVGQSTSALSGLSIRLKENPLRLCFLSLYVVERGMFIRGRTRHLTDNLIFFKGGLWEGKKFVFVRTQESFCVRSVA